MVAYGGNGPIHARACRPRSSASASCSCRRPSPAFSALGLLLADYVVDGQRSYIAPSGRASAERVNAIFAELEAEAERELARGGARARATSSSGAS